MKQFTVSVRHPLEPWLHEPGCDDRIRSELRAARPLVKWLAETIGPSTRAAELAPECRVGAARRGAVARGPGMRPRSGVRAAPSPLPPLQPAPPSQDATMVGFAERERP